MKCSHENIMRYQEIQWCRDCGAFKAKNHVRWTIPTYIFRDAELKLMKNRESEDEKIDGT